MAGEVVPAVMPPAKGHTAYSSLVQDGDDLVGLMAYSLYKRDKLDFLQKHHQENGKGPSPEELLAFSTTCTLPGPISAYRAQATYHLQSMYDALLEDATEELDERYQEKLLQELKHAHPFWMGVWQKLIASLMAWAIVGGLILILYGYKIGYKDLVIDIFGLHKSPTEQKSN